MKTICVCGAGTMGSGIAQVVAQSGFTTIQFDVNAEMIERSKSSIDKNLQLLVAKGKLNDHERINVFNRIIFTSNISDCKADIIIEAIVEDIALKVDLFKQISAINNSETIFATNTSSLSINAIANELPNKKHIVGLHFFNPATIMKLVEVVRGNETRDEVVNEVVHLSLAFGKTPVICKDVPGFIVNRVARPYYLEAMKLVEDGVADVEKVDAILESSGFKMGPFKLMDLIGMDINYSVSNIVWNALGKPDRLTPSTLQKQKVENGELGKKTGRGFYKY